MNKIHLFFILFSLFFLPINAQKVTVSPLPQQITWGGKAFDSSALGQIKITKGIVDDKKLAKYRKLVPQKKGGYYLKISSGENANNLKNPKPQNPKTTKPYNRTTAKPQNRITVQPQNRKTEIILIAHDADGLFYGEQTLNQITSQPEVMSCEVVDYPSVECRGVIEGFYGNPWSHKDRLRQFDFYGRNKMNIYVYGPKDDPYHRANWREPYPDDKAAQLTELVNAARKNHVQFVWAIHPGGDIQWNRQDSLAVVNKLEKMYSLGIRTFAVFFDDIEGEGASAEKQAGLLNYVTDQFVHKHKDVQPLIMCPTCYNKAWSDETYLPTLGRALYKEVRIMWTGNTVVDMIDRKDMEWINAQIGRKAFIWLNYPVNDYCQSRLLMGKTYGNGLDIDDMVSGFCSNPMEYAEASKVSLYSIADYTWNMPQYDSVSSWERAMSTLMPTCKDAFRFFCENNIDLGVTGHKLRREGESPDFCKNETATPQTRITAKPHNRKTAKPHNRKTAKPQNDVLAYYSRLSSTAETLLADSINQPEMLGEIRPWVESMNLLGQRGIASEQMAEALSRNDTIGFIGLYRAQQLMERRQKAITSRDYEGSIVKAKPLVSGDVVSPYVKAREAALIQEYRKNHTYGLEYLPLQPIQDGEYFIMYDGKYLTDAQAGAKKTGDYPVFLAERDNINPQRQQWVIEWDYNVERYKITNKQDGRYINENGTFWENTWDRFNAEEHTYIIRPEGNGFTLQCADKGGNGYWSFEADRLKNTPSATTFTLIPLR